MKNLKKVGTVLLGALLVTLAACQQGPKKQEPSEPVSEEQERVEPPSGIISLEESKSLYDNYTKNRLDIIQRYEAERSPEKKFEASRFTSFTYDDIKQYMAYIEQEAKEAQVDISSLRFYFANYPDQEDFPDGKKIVHPRQNSLFIVPTMKVNGEDYGFYIGEDGKAKLIKDAVGAKGIGNNAEAGEKSYAGFVPSTATTTSLQETKSLALNKGGSGPPPWGDY